MNWIWLNKYLIKTLSVCFFVNAAMFLPQIYTLYNAKNSESLSLSMWGFFVFANAVLSLHCAIEKKRGMAIGSGFSMIFSGVIFGMILYYRQTL